MVQSAAIIAFFLTAAAYGKSLPRVNTDGRIVNGTMADILDFPNQVSLQRGGSHFCGASIISTQWVLTAAHCVRSVGSNNISPRSLRLRVGSPNWTEGGSLHSASEVKSHSRFSQHTVDCDVAVIRVAVPFAGGPSVHPIALPRAGESLLPGTPVTVSGWGKHAEHGSNRLSKTLRYAELEIVEHGKCKSVYYSSGADMPDVTSRMICASAVGRDSCQGDSGGPLTYEGTVQYGIVSWGYGCARPHYPGIYTDLSDHDVRGFIYKHTGL